MPCGNNSRLRDLMRIRPPLHPLLTYGLLPSAKTYTRADFPPDPQRDAGVYWLADFRWALCELLVSLHSSPVDSQPGGRLKLRYVSQRGQLCFWFRCWKVTGGSHTLGALCLLSCSHGNCILVRVGWHFRLFWWWSVFVVVGWLVILVLIFSFLQKELSKQDFKFVWTF